MAGRRTLAPGLAAVTLTAALGAGCSFSGGFGEGYRCSVGDTCPTGTSCVAGFCVVAEPLDAMPDGPPGPDADISEAACGTLSLLQDSFTDPGDGAYWDPFWDVGATVAETGGQLAIGFGGGTGSPYGGYTSAFLYDLTGGAIAVAVPQTGGDNTILEVRTHAGEKIQLVAEPAALVAVILDAANEGERARIPFDAVAHAHWRIREADGTLYWETSPDGTDWSELASEPVSFSVEHVEGIASAGGQRAVASEARFDSVNEGVTAGRFCPSSTVTDSFDTAPFSPIWENWSVPGCTIAETGGDLVMTFTGLDGAFCGIGSRHLVDLRDSELVLDATNVPPETMFVIYFQVIRPGDDETHLEINREGNTLGFEQTVDGTDTATGSTLYSATDHRYWRLRESGGTIFWDTSPDGVAWSNEGEAAVMFDLSNVEIIVGAGHYGPGTGAAHSVRFGGVN